MNNTNKINIEAQKNLIIYNCSCFTIISGFIPFFKPYLVNSITGFEIVTYDSAYHLSNTSIFTLFVVYLFCLINVIVFAFKKFNTIRSYLLQIPFILLLLFSFSVMHTYDNWRMTTIRILTEDEVPNKKWRKID